MDPRTRGDSPAPAVRANPTAGFRWLPVMLAASALLFACSCSRPLPEADSAEARLYAERCGGCHSPYQPGLQTAAMWELTLTRMEATRMRSAGIRLDDADRHKILAYLTRNAGGH